MRMAPTVIQGSLQSMEMSFRYQNLKFLPTCRHNLRELPRHNVSPPLTRSSPCHPLLQSLSPDQLTATLSHTRPLSLSFLMIIQEKSIPTRQPIVHLRLSILASGSCWRNQERARAHQQRESPPPHLRPNDTPSLWRILLPSTIREVAHSEERRPRTGSVPVSLLVLRHLCLQNLSVAWAVNPNLHRNLLLSSKNKQSRSLPPATREMHPAFLLQRNWRRW